MGKTCKMAGALALSAALALGTAAPAFAETKSGETYGGDGNSMVVDGSNTITSTGSGVTDDGSGNLTFGGIGPAEGSTQVRVLSEVTQINATVPVMVYVVADTAGGPLLATPTGTGAATGEKATGAGAKAVVEYSGYRIENRSNVKIYVTNVKADASDTKNWDYEDADFTNIDITKKDAASTAKGRIHLTVTPYKTRPEYTAELGGTGGVTGIFDSTSWVKDNKLIKDKVVEPAITTPHNLTAAGSAVEWEIAAQTLTDSSDATDVAYTPGVLGLSLGGMTSRIDRDAAFDFAAMKQDENYFTTGAGDEVTATDKGDVKIVYTVSATKGSGSGSGGTGGSTE